jgi:aspartyl-tRNA(Asn)/glutamyl-tRNA(Gln) amidotransferase subunit C
MVPRGGGVSETEGRNMSEADSQATAAGMDVRGVAALARLRLTEEEVQVFQPQLEQIVGYVRKIQELDLEGIEPTAHAIAVENVFREDEARPGLATDLVMQNAPAGRNGQFVVPRIVE